MDNTDTGVVSVTAQEAEEIFELWAKRQTDSEALRSRLTVQEMAEAMSIPQSEVEQLLIAVRAKPKQSPIQPPLERVKPINKPLIALATILWFGIIFSVALNLGQSSRQTVIGTYSGYETAPAGFAGYEDRPVGSQASLPSRISKGVKISYGGYTVEGEAARSFGSSQIVDVIKDILKQIPATQTNTPNHLPDIAIINALQQNKPELAENLIKFEKISISSDKRFDMQMIPISLTTNGRVNRLVAEEREKRIQALAKSVAQQVPADAMRVARNIYNGE